MGEPGRVLAAYGAILVVLALIGLRLTAHAAGKPRPWPHGVPAQLWRYLVSLVFVLGAVLLGLALFGPAGPRVVVALGLPPLAAVVFIWWRRTSSSR